MKRHALRGNDIRESNEKLVLSLIFERGTTSQSEIVQATGLKAPTVFRIFSKLEEDGFIRQCVSDDPDETRRSVPVPVVERKGRRPNYYCIRPDSGCAIGVDFSSLAASVIVVNFGNEVIYHESTEFPSGLDRDEVLDRVARLIRDAIAARTLDFESVLGIGIAAPGVVDTVTGRVVVYDRIAGLNDYSIKDRYEAEFGVPVYVHNNANVIAASAYHHGSARHEESLLAILVRSGVGGALIENGQVFLNGTRTALEIGSLRAGILIASDPGVTATDPDRLESIVAEGPMLARLQDVFGVQSWSEAEARLSATDVANALAPARRALAAAARDLHHVFRPEAILLITRFPLLAEALGSAVREAVPTVRVISMVYDPVQACYGATDLVFRYFFAASPN